MNHIYRLVWNQASQRFVAAPETARSRGKGASGKKSAVVMAICAVLGAGAWATPAGWSITSGGGSITQTGSAGASTTTVYQTTSKMSANWASLNTSKNETVNFIQPSATSVAVNRVLSNSATEFFGKLNANGQVYLINPNGVMFGQGSQINVGGLVASTLDVSDAAVGSNAQVFSGNSAASVSNAGTITAHNGGVALLGAQVSNTGSIIAYGGTVALGAGSNISLSFNGNRLMGLQVKENQLQALAFNGGLIQADGGHVLMSAGAKDSLIASVVNNTGVIQARTVSDAGNGVIELLGGMKSGTVNVGGTLDASAPKGGNGGRIETSAAKVKVSDSAVVTTRAASGKTGTWLIDPTNFTVAASGGDMTGTAVSAALANNNFQIQSAQGTSGTQGDINVNDAITWSSGTTLTLTADHNIYLNASIDASHNSGGKLALEFGQGSGKTGDYFVNAPVYLQAGQNFSTKLADGSTQTYTVVTDTAGLQAIANSDLTSNYALGSNIDASSIDFQPIGASSAFTGVLAGLGHSVQNIAIHQDASGVGLVGHLGQGGVVRDIGLSGGSVQGKGDVGALVGVNDGSVSHVYSTASVTGSDSNVGGLVGNNNSSSISNAYSAGAVSGADAVGGLVGNNSGSVANSYASGAVSATGSNVGGLVGQDSGGTYTANLWSTDGTGQSNGVGNAASQAGVTGSLSSDLSTTATKAGWDLTQTWLAGDNGPVLQGLMTHVVVKANDLELTYGGYTFSGGNGVKTYSGDKSYDERNLDTSNLNYDAGTSKGASNAGTYTITAGGLKNGTTQDGYIFNYQSGTLTIDKAQVTVTGVVANNKVYDGTTNASIKNNNISATVSLGAWDGKNASTSSPTAFTDYTVKGAFSDATAGAAKTVNLATSLGNTSNSNYVLSSSSQTTATANINQALVKVSGVTASNKVYDTTTGALITNQGSAVVVLGDSSKADGSTLAASSYTSGYTVAGSFASSAASTGTNSSTVNLTTALSDKTNYALATSSQSTTTAKISAAQVTVSDVVVSGKVYDTTKNATVTSSKAMAQLGDATKLDGSLATPTQLASGYTVTGTFTSPDAGTAKAVSISTNVTDKNYALASTGSQTTASADILQAMVTISGVTASNKVYDTTTNAKLTLGTATVQLGDSTKANGAVASTATALKSTDYTLTGAFSDANVGTGKTVSFVLGGNANYMLSTSSSNQTSTKGNISAAQVTVNGVTASNKVYDKTTNAAVTAGTGTVLLGDASKADGSTLSQAFTAYTEKGTFTTADVGTAKTVNLTTVLKDTQNYALTTPTTSSSSQQSSTSANITPALVTISGVTGVDKAYDKTTAATIAGGSAAVQYGDATKANGSLAAPVAFTGYTITAAFATPEVGANKVIGLSPVLDNPVNFSLSSTSQTLAKASITPPKLNNAASQALQSTAAPVSAPVVIALARPAAGSSNFVLSSADDAQDGGSKAVLLQELVFPTQLNLTSTRLGTKLPKMMMFD